MPSKTNMRYGTRGRLLPTYSPSDSAIDFEDDHDDSMTPPKRNTHPDLDVASDMGHHSTSRNVHHGRQRGLRSNQHDRSPVRETSSRQKQPVQATAGASSLNSARGQSKSAHTRRHESPASDFRYVDFEEIADDPRRHASLSQKKPRGTKRSAAVFDEDDENEDMLNEDVAPTGFVVTDEPLFVGQDEVSSEARSTEARSTAPPDEPSPVEPRVKRNKASTLKERLSQKSKQPGKPGRRSKDVVHDEINLLIKDLRQHQHYSWGAIVKELNRRAQLNGEVASFTDAAVYGRFVRNAPRIAEFNGEHDFNCKDYMYLKYTHRGETEPQVEEDREPRFSEQADELLVKAVAQVDTAAERERWTRVAQALEMQNVNITAEQAMRRHARL
ncbi:hypothetical protein K490DRAFT_63793 [Saccharata proteae CBS 121410]|uniref:Uncharacterized protein n=1 Tax=Saccharata proteae CBS 121410 TaxID=1314787 RepID=A0A6A5YFH1_9PEZI|nr:hypothetical protein K490DRAFT_63793 [Saccharata proteae CBS 121410]